MQKRAACIILEAHRTTRTVTMFNNLNWIPFYNEAYINRCALAYKKVNGILPNYINASLRTNSDAHSRNTRYCNLNLLCPLYRNTSEGGRTFTVRTVKDWNKGSKSIRTKTSLKSFKTELLKSILNSQKTKGSFEIQIGQYKSCRQLITYLEWIAIYREFLYCICVFIDYFQQFQLEMFYWNPFCDIFATIF
jgi:hypothetical protein